MRSASARKSNSPRMTSRYARKTVGKSTPLSRRAAFKNCVVRSMLRTSATIVASSAISTFTTTLAPFDRSVARWTWAMDAVASGVGSKDENVASKERVEEPPTPRE